MHRRALAASAAFTSLLVCLAWSAVAQGQPGPTPAPTTTPNEGPPVQPAPPPVDTTQPVPAPPPPTEPVPPPVVAPPPVMAPPPPVVVAPPPAAPEPPPATKPSDPAKDIATRIGDFMDTRLTWTLGDDDFLHQTGQAQPLSPILNVGDRKQYRLFFDNLNSRFGGRENLTHLALYKKMPGFIKNLDTEASLVLRLDISALAARSGNLNQAFYDAGSYIRAFYHTDGKSDGKTGLGLTLWPIDTDRFRLGYLYDISWGGTNASINQSIFPRLVGSSPGGKIQYDGDGFSAFFGFKTASIVQIEETLIPGTSEVDETKQAQTNVGILAGASFDATEMVHIDAGGGFFQQGRFEFPDVAKQPIYTFGASARVVVHHKDMPVAQSIDFLLYRNDPNKPQIIFKPETYTPDKTTWSASLEASNLAQNLTNFETAGATTLQGARAVALQGNVKSGFMRGSLTAIYRDLPFVLRNQPSFIPFKTLPREATTTNELFFAAAGDYYIESAHLTPGIGLGVQLPATFQSDALDTSSALIHRVTVVREQGNISILPLNEDAVPIIQARFSLKWDVSKILSTIAWFQYVRDNNGNFLARDPSEGTVVLRKFIAPDFFGFGTSVQARF